MGKAQQASSDESAILGDYLHRLRTANGYSLRVVEERARAVGADLDASLLNRYENGRRLPSFNKLRVLADVFRVPVQLFFDVVDLATLSHLKPVSGCPAELIRDGIAAARSGDNRHSFACFDRALEVLRREKQDSKRDASIARVSINRANALRRLGKLALAERELITVTHSHLDDSLLVRALLGLAIVHLHKGAAHISELIANRSYDIARVGTSDIQKAQSLSVLAKAVYQQGRYRDALGIYRQAASQYSECCEVVEQTKVQCCIASCYAYLGQYHEAIRLTRTSISTAARIGQMQLQSIGWSNLGEVFYRMKRYADANRCFASADTIASRTDDMPVHFHTGYYRWRIAVEKENPTAAKMEFARLKKIRARLENWSVEIDKFDRVLQDGGGHNHV